MIVPCCALFALAVAAAAPPTSTDGWVVLPTEEYRALRVKAFPPDPEPSPPPVDATLTRVDYDLAATSDTVGGEARLTIDVLKEGFVRIPIPPGLLVKEARIDGRPVALLEGPVGKAASAPEILLGHTGRSVLTLGVVTPIAVASGAESFSLPASDAALTRIVLRVPRVGVDLSLGGGLLSEKTEGKGETRFLVHANAGTGLTFSWQRKRDNHRASEPLRLRGSLTHVVGLGEDAYQATVHLRLEIAQGVAPSVRLLLPDGFVVNHVAGEAVADWEATADRLTVSFLEPLEREASLVITGETRAIREGTLAVPLLRLADAERENGGVAVEVLGAGEIKRFESRGMDPADAADLGEPVTGRDSPSLLAFRFKPGGGQVPRSLTVDVARYTPQAVMMANVDEARYRVLLSEEGKTLVEARYAVRNNRRGFLELTLPPQATLWSAAVAGRPVRPGLSADGALLLPLEKGRSTEEAPAFAVDIVYFQRGDAWARAGRARVALPALDLGVSRTGLVVHHSPRFVVKPDPGAFRAQTFQAPVSEAFRVTQPAASKPTAAVERKLEDAQEGDRREVQKAVSEVQGLVDRYQRETARGARVTGALPIAVPFPTVGPSLFFVSELTAEATAPSLDLTYKREGKR